MVKPQGFEMKAACFLDLSLPLLLCHSTRLRVVSFFLRMLRSSASPTFSSSCLNCRPSSLSSCRSSPVGLPFISGQQLFLYAKLFCSNADYCSHCPQLLVDISLCSGFKDLVQVHIELEPLSFLVGHMTRRCSECLTLGTVGCLLAGLLLCLTRSWT